MFTDHAAAIGLTGAQASAFAQAVAAARAAREAQGEALQAYRAATEVVESEMRALRALTGDTVNTIRAFAEASPEPVAVYTTAQVQPPEPPAPLPAPTRPTNLRATLDATTGALTITWDARQPRGARGTTYLIARRLPGEHEPTFLGTGAPGKRFTDTTLPAGATEVFYTVRPYRGGTPGPQSEVLAVNIGTGKGASVGARAA